MTGTWPDGLPVHDLVLHVRLSCGHERNARGWRGEEGSTYCCDVCGVLAQMEEISLTDEPPSPWSYKGQVLPTCPDCGAVPGSSHGSPCPFSGPWRPTPYRET